MPQGTHRNEGVQTSAENRLTGPQEAVWGTVKAVAVARPGHGYSGVGDMTLIEDGDLAFTPARPGNSPQRFRLDEPDLWLRVDDEASDWPQAGIDGSKPVIVISAGHTRPGSTFSATTNPVVRRLGRSPPAGRWPAASARLVQSLTRSPRR
jgi:hypothetical protein